MKAYYLNFIKGHHGSLNRVGGQPSFLATDKPWALEDDEIFGFLMELWCDEVHLSIPGVQCIQFYQSIEEGDDPLPRIVLIRNDAKPNINKIALVHPSVEMWDITFTESDDPEFLPKMVPTVDFGKLFKSKLKGLDPWKLNSNHTFLGQISEMPVGFNFGGMICSFYLQSEKVFLELN